MTEPESEEQSHQQYRLRRQWILTKGPVAFSGWPSHEFREGYRLHAHPHTRVRSWDHGDVHAVLLGVACRSDGRQVFDGLDGFSRGFDDEAALRAIDQLVGCYALLVDHPEHGLSLFTDPAALMNVFRRGAELASSPALFEGVDRDPDVAAVFSLNPTDDWMTGSRTLFAGVRAMPANHRVDVASGRADRFWPREPIERVSSAEAVRRGTELLRHSAASLVRDHRVLLSLTGGLDSRVMLAAFRDHAETIETFTLDVLNRRERALVDDIVRLSGVEHRFLKPAPTPDDVMALYDGMTLGQSLGSRRTVAGTCWQLRDTDGVHVSGNLGAIAKAFYWPDGHPTWPTPGLLTRDFIQRSWPIEEGAREWIGSLPDTLSPSDACNLMYLEQRGSRWMGIGETASNLFYSPATLFCSRGLFESICSAPVEDQRGGRLLRAYVREIWPELADVPYASGTSAWKRMVPKRIKAVVAPYVKRTRS